MAADRSLSSVAAKSGLSRSTVWRLPNGREEPTAWEMEQIAKGFRRQAGHFVGYRLGTVMAVLYEQMVKTPESSVRSYAAIAPDSREGVIAEETSHVIENLDAEEPFLAVILLGRSPPGVVLFACAPRRCDDKGGGRSPLPLLRLGHHHVASTASTGALGTSILTLYASRCSHGEHSSDAML